MSNTKEAKARLEARRPLLYAVNSLVDARNCYARYVEEGRGDAAYASLQRVIDDAKSVQAAARDLMAAARPEAEKRRARVVEMADAQHAESSGIEIDADAVVSEGDDNGAYVAAWLWVDFVGTPFTKDADGERCGCGGMNPGTNSPCLVADRCGWKQ